MRKAPKPANETERLFTLRALSILDTPPEERFDKYVEFACKEFSVPIVAISLIDHDRQWFKASVGLNVCETARDISFCGHTIISKTPLVVEDTLLDHRFCDNPLVSGVPFIRFYAGISLILPSGYAVGSFCLIDTVPRKLTSDQIEVLTVIRDIVVVELVRTQFINAHQHNDATTRG